MSVVLVVEDDEEYRAVLVKILGEAGYDVAAAPNCAEGLRLFAERRPDLIMLDVVLPDMLGFEFCKIIRAGASRPNTPILFCTVRSAVSQLARGVNAGGTDYVLKPFVPEDLLARVRAALGGRRP